MGQQNAEQEAGGGQGPAEQGTEGKQGERRRSGENPRADAETQPAGGETLTRKARHEAWRRQIGEVFREKLTLRDVTPKGLALRCGVPLNRVETLIEGSGRCTLEEVADAARGMNLEPELRLRTRRETTAALPKTLEDLLLTAIADARKVLADETTYRFRDGRGTHAGRRGNERCAVSLAGCVMAARLGAEPWETRSASEYGKTTWRALIALDDLRNGAWWAAAGALHGPEVWGDPLVRSAIEEVGRTPGQVEQNESEIAEWLRWAEERLAPALRKVDERTAQARRETGA